MKHLLIILMLVILLFGSCDQKANETPEFIEIRITRRFALIHARETLLLRKVGSEWSSTVFGHTGLAGLCDYQRSVSAKSGAENLWNSLVSYKLLELNSQTNPGIEDGSAFEIEITHQRKLRRFSIVNPTPEQSQDSAQMLEISNLINKEFDLTAFTTDSRANIDDYFLRQCRRVNQDQ